MDNKYQIIYDYDTNDGFITYGIIEFYDDYASFQKRVDELKKFDYAFNIEGFYPLNDF